jgi:DNA-directed RNA polymerase specialized sigma24 family protein
VVFLLARLVLRDEREAEEATLEAFEEVWRRAGEFESSDHSASSWIVRIANERAFARRRMLAGAVPGALPGSSAHDGSTALPDRPTYRMREVFVQA